MYAHTHVYTNIHAYAYMGINTHTQSMFQDPWLIIHSKEEDHENKS